MKLGLSIRTSMAAGEEKILIITKNTHKRKCVSCQTGALRNPTQGEEMEEEKKKVSQESEQEQE